MIGKCRNHCGDPDGESLKSYFDVEGYSLGRRAKRFLEAEGGVEPDQTHDVVGIDVDGRVAERCWHGWRRLIQDACSLRQI